MTAITAEEMSVYRATAQERHHRRQDALRKRRSRALTVANKLAAMLRTQFGATRVMLFGSSIQSNCYSRTSDIDLAVWGIAPSHFYIAVAHCQDQDPEFAVDLIDMEDCPPNLHKSIVDEGIDL